FFHLLVGLLAGPARLERRNERLEGRVRGVVGEVILRLAARAPLADEPPPVARATTMSDDRIAVGDANAQRAELGAEHPLGSTAPRDRPEGVRTEGGDHILRASRFGGRFVRRARSARRRLRLDR